MSRKRKNGDGTIRQRSDGRWEGRYVVGYDERGYPKTKSVLAKTKRECADKLSALKEKLGGIKSGKLKADMRFGDWMDYWFENHAKSKIRPTTQDNYSRQIRLHINPELGQIPLNKLSQNDLQQFYARLKKSGRKRFAEKHGEGVSDRVVRMNHALCRTALDKAVQEGLIRNNPAVGCKLPPKKAKEMQVLDRDELQRFLIQAQAEGYYELFLLELATGLRRGELLALQWDDLDFQTGVLNVSKQVYTVNGELQFTEPKTKNSVRSIVLPPSILTVLAEYKKTVVSRWMFPSPVKDDVPTTPEAVYSKLTGILERAGCKKLRFHDLRHTFATLALQGGMDIKTLSAMLGHVSAATTLDIYTHITDDMQRQAAVNIDLGIGKVEPAEADVKHEPDKEVSPKMTDYHAVMPTRRRAGTGCISQINENCFEGRYSPIWIDGKKRARNVYARSREECEEKLQALIIEMKTELAELKRQRAAEAEKPKKSTKKKLA